MWNKGGRPVLLAVFSEKAPGACGAPLQSLSAGSRVAQLLVAAARLPARSQRLFNIASAAGTGICQSGCYQAVQCGLVKAAALRLVQRRCVGQQATGGQLLHDQRVSARYAARRVNVFDTYQPTSCMCAGIEPACQRGDHGARMQRASWRGRKTADISSRHAGHVIHPLVRSCMQVRPPG